MSLGPVDWVEGMHNEKVVSVCFVKIGHFGTKWVSTDTDTSALQTTFFCSTRFSSSVLDLD